MIKVAYVARGWPPEKYANGIVSYIGNIYQDIKLENIDPVILALSVQGQIGSSSTVIDLSKIETPNQIFKIMRRFIPLSLHINLVSAQKILIAIENYHKGVDIIEVEEARGLAIGLKKRLSTKIITRVHGPWFLCGPPQGNKTTLDDRCRIRLERKALVDSDGITAPSKDVIDRIREYYDYEFPSACVIPNSVIPTKNYERWQNTESSVPSILFVGRFDRLKGGDLLLSAFRIIALQNKDVILKFIGPDNGVNLNGLSFSFDEYVKKYIPERYCRDRIEYLGKRSPSFIRTLRKEATVTVVCSRYETFSLSLVEAMSAGCPVVATKVGGMKEIISDNETGLFAEPESAESIAEMVIKLLDDKALRVQLSRAAISHCSRKFHPKLIAREMSAYYKKIINN